MGQSSENIIQNEFEIIVLKAVALHHNAESPQFPGAIEFGSNPISEK